METRQLRADRRRGDLGGVLRARSGQPRIGFGFGMVLVREVRGVLLLLYRGAHPAHDERIQVPEIHARHLVRPDADRRGQSLHPEVLRLQRRRKLLAVRSRRTLDAHHPQRGPVFLVLQRRRQLRRLDGTFDGRLFDLGALLPQSVDEDIPAAGRRRGLLRHADFGHAQRAGRAVRRLHGLHHDVAQHQSHRHGRPAGHRGVRLPEVHLDRAGQRLGPACAQRLQLGRSVFQGPS